jgi:hypothetical protein
MANNGGSIALYQIENSIATDKQTHMSNEFSKDPHYVHS